MLNKPLRVLGQVGWTIKPDGPLHWLAKGFLMHMTDINPDLLHPDEDQISGSVHHRYQDSRSSHGGAATTLFTQSKKIAMDTSTLVKRCKGSTNVNLFFQGLMCLGNYIIGGLLTNRLAESGGVYHLHLRKSCCIRDVDETLLDLPAFYTDISQLMTINKESPYLYKPSKQLFDSLLLRHLRIPRAPKDTTEDGLITRRACIVAHECMRMLRTADLESHNDSYHGSSVVLNWMSYTILCGRELFFQRILTLLALSPNHTWKRLENVMHMPSVMTQAALKPWTTKLPGNPQMGEDEASVLMKAWVLNVLTVWSRKEDPALPTLECYSRPCGSVDQHPAHLMVMRDFLVEKISAEEAHSRMLSIRKMLRNSPSLEAPPPKEVKWSREDLKRLDEGDLYLTSQTADRLSKDAPSYVIPYEDKLSLPEEDMTGIAEVVHSLQPDLHKKSAVYAFPMDVSKEYQSVGIVHTYKIANLPTTAAYKILDIVYSTNIQDIPASHIFCAGDGSGGYSLVFGMLFPTAKIIYNTLLEPTPNVQQLPPIVQLPAIAPHPSIEARLLGLDLVNYGLSELTHPCYPKVFSRRFPCSIEVIVCDAEGGGWEDSGKALLITKNLIEIAKISRTMVVIIKTYGSNPTTVRGQAVLASKVFGTIKLFRTPYSTKGNTELFLVCTNRHNKIIDTELKVYPKKVYMIAGPHLEGLNDNTMTSIITERLNNHKIPDVVNAGKYTTFLHQVSNDQDSATSMQEAISIVHPGATITFPQDYIKLIKSVHSFRSKEASKVLGRGILVKLPREFMSKISIQWLALWGAARIQEGQEPDIEQVIAEAHFCPTLLWKILGPTQPQDIRLSLLITIHWKSHF